MGLSGGRAECEGFSCLNHKATRKDLETWGAYVDIKQAPATRAILAAATVGFAHETTLHVVGNVIWLCSACGCAERRCGSVRAVALGIMFLLIAEVRGRAVLVYRTSQFFSTQCVSVAERGALLPGVHGVSFAVFGFLCVESVGGMRWMSCPLLTWSGLGTFAFAQVATRSRVYLGSCIACAIFGGVFAGACGRVDLELKVRERVRIASFTLYGLFIPSLVAIVAYKLHSD